MGVVSPAAAAPAITSLKLLSAAHSRLGDVRTILQTAGSLVAVEPGDTLRVAFRAAATAGARTDLFVAVTGGWSKLTTPGLRSIADKADLPRVFALYPARPNPFRASTRIRFDVPHPERVDIEIFDLQGRRVRSLMHGVQPAGMHDVSWDHVSNAGSRVAPGVYVYRMIAGTFHDQRKLVLLP